MKSYKKVLKKGLSFVLSFNLLLQSFVPFILTPVYAEDSTPSAETVTATPTPEVTPEVTPTPTPTEEVTPTPTPDPTPEITPEATPSPTVEVTPTVEPTPTDAPEITPEPSSNTDSQAPPAENNQSSSSDTPQQPAPTPTPTPSVPETLTIASNLEQTLTAQPTLTTDKSDYFPTDIAYISGTGFLAGTTYTLHIQSSDNPAVSYKVEVTTDENGSLSYTYQLDGHYRPNYQIDALDPSGKIVASMSFTDSSIPVELTNGDLRGEKKNGDWSNGNLCSGPGDCFSEGDQVKHRETFSGLTIGNTYFFYVSHDYQCKSDGSLGYADFNNPEAFSGSSNITMAYESSSSDIDTHVWKISFDATASTSEVRWNALLSTSASGCSGSNLHVYKGSGGSQSVQLPVNAVTPITDISITKTAPDTASRGDSISYSLTVTNLDAFTSAQNVTVTDTLPTGTTYVSASGAICTNNLGTITCNLGTLAGGASQAVTINVTVNNSESFCGTTITNTATVSTTTLESDSTNNSSSDSTDISSCLPALTIVKTATPTTYDAVGDIIGYSFLVTNSGNVSLTGPVTINDDKATDESCPLVTTVGNNDNELDPGESLTCTASYTITQADLDAGLVTNVASATVDSITSPTDTETVNADQNPALTLDKTTSTTDFDATADTLSYSYLVTNTGNVRLFGPVTVSDDKATVTCPNVNTVGNFDSYLNVGESLTCTASYTITQADINAGSVTNKATASVAGTDSNEDSVTVYAVQNPALTIVKTATPTTYDAVGDIIGYSFLVTNSGNVTLSGPFTVTDDKSTDESCPVTATLIPSASITCTASYTITQADLDAGSVTNIASASNGTITSPIDIETVNADQNPSMTVKKSSTTFELSSAPTTVSYSYLVTNTGNVTLTGISLTDDNDDDDMSCPFTSLAPSGTMTCAATHSFTQAELDAGGSLNNTVTASSNEAPDATDNLSIPISQSASLTIEKLANVDTVNAAGNIIGYTITVTNTGNITITGVSVNDTLLTNLDCDGDPLNSTFINSGMNIDVGSSLTCSGSYTILQSDIDNNGGGDGDVDNTATADSDQTGSTAASEEVAIIQNPLLNIDKDSTTTSITAAGQSIPYTFTVTNTGNQTLSGITVSDPNCTSAITGPTGDANADSKLDLTETWVYSCTHTVTQAELNAGGNLSNTVTADSTESDPDTDSLNIPVTQSPSMTVEKSSTTFELSSAPTTVNYSYLVTNTGNVTLTGINLSDDNDEDDMNCPATTLAPQGTMTCSATHAFTQSELDAGGTLDNTVTASSKEAPNATASLSITITQRPSIDIEKSSTTTSISTAGQVVPYTFVVTNTGNQTLTDITVTDANCDVAPVYQSGDTNSDSKLDLTEIWTYACSHTVSQNEYENDEILSNTVTVDSEESVSDTDTLNIRIIRTPKLTISRTNNAGSPLTPGSSYEHTITIRVIGNNISNLILTDLLPKGVTFSDKYTVLKGSTDITESITVTGYHSPGVWKLGDFEEGDVITVTYLANISSDIKPGIYKDISWAIGDNPYAESEQSIYATGEDSEFVSDIFVGTVVEIVKDQTNGGTYDVENKVVGQVLGASTSLPATGANELWLAAALLSLFFGIKLVRSKKAK